MALMLGATAVTPATERRTSSGGDSEAEFHRGVVTGLLEAGAELGCLQDERQDVKIQVLLVEKCVFFCSKVLGGKEVI